MECGNCAKREKREKRIAFITSIAYFRGHKNIELIRKPKIWKKNEFY